VGEGRDDAGAGIGRLIERLGDEGALDAGALAPLLDDAPAARGLLRLARILGAVHALATADADLPAAAEAAAPDRAGQVLGPWRLLRLLGRGGMGEVWLAERCDGQLRQQVALKRVRSATPALVRRMLRERELLARLSHPNIARFLDAGVDAAGVPFLVLEYVEGEPIDRWCAARASPLRERIDLLLAVGEALAHAHRHLIVHRDLKPANVLVDAGGTPRLLDFGIAKLLDDTAAGQTETGLAAMTPAWAAPEQLLGGEVTTATDVHALGLLGFELLAGALPALRRELPLAKVALRLAQEEPERASEAARRNPSAPVAPAALEGDLDAVLAKALRPEAGGRYADVASMLADLRAWQAGLPVEARAGQRGYRLRRLAWRHRGWIAAGTLAVGGLAGGGALAWVQAQRAIEASQTAQVVQHFLEDVFISADPWRARVPGQPTTALELAERGLARIEADLAGQPRAQSELYIRLARVFSIEGDAAQARRAAARADELLAGLPGATFAEQAMARAVHAQYVFYAGDYDTSQALLEDLLARHAAAELDTVKAGVVAYSLVHDIARDRGDYPRALRWLDRTTAAADQTADPARMRVNLRYYRSVVELRRGAVDRAAVEALAALEGLAARPAESPQWRAHVVDRCAKVLLALGPATEDLAFAERNRAQRAAMFGEGGGYDAQSQLTLAAARVDAGDAAGAAEAAARAVARFGGGRDDDRDFSEARYLAALAALAGGDDAGAAALADAAAAGFAALGGEGAPPALAARAAAAWARRAGDPQALDTLARIAERQAARGDLEAPRSWRWLALAADARGDLAARADAARRGLAVLGAQGRPEHAFVREFAAGAGEPVPAGSGDSAARLRAAIAAALDRIDADLAASRPPSGG
jgi:serine/threonine-protein kinase